MALTNDYLRELATKTAGDAVEITAHPDDAGGDIDETITLGSTSVIFQRSDEEAEIENPPAEISITEPEATGVKFLVVRQSNDDAIDIKELSSKVGISGDEIEKIIKINQWTISFGSTDV